MSLQSKLFKGDPKLEAAAVSDPAHITPGASGAHVNKIQAALLLIDGATIPRDELLPASYGSRTSDAVLAYKQKRNIVNQSYETQADNIVGKMTMASLDGEMLKQEALSHKPVQIRPISQFRLRPQRTAELAALMNPPAAHAMLGFAVGAAAVGPAITPLPGLTGNVVVGPTVVLEMRRNSVADIVVSGGSFGNVTVADPNIVKLRPDILVAPGASALVVDDPQTFKVFSGGTLGSTTITASTLAFADGSSASIEVVVKTFFTPPAFGPAEQGISHGHRASGKWPQIQANPNSGFLEELACKNNSPQGVIDLAKKFKFGDKPIALKHVDWYLKDGQGRDFVEDDNINDWLRRDQGIRRRLKREIFRPGAKPRTQGHFEFLQPGYAEDQAGQDFRFAFGSIDKVFFEVDLAQDTVRVWFKDRYEWHPVYPGIYDFKPGDGVRDTNCVHAAFVEMKISGAADFWMVGVGEVNLSLIAKP